MVGCGDVGDLHRCAIVGDLLAGTEGDYAEKHDLGELRGVGKRRRGLTEAFCGGDPVQFVRFPFNARELLRDWRRKCRA